MVDSGVRHPQAHGFCEARRPVRASSPLVVNHPGEPGSGPGANGKDRRRPSNCDGRGRVAEFELAPRGETPRGRNACCGARAG